ncbi:PepSY-associated TM helix domain-containing protein [Arenimonas fontis]|uniref:PepSY domain-containing protein n=1 Tax=Arenimonas fontis TaxID=2608255 RepID=A0A5B2ZDD3_9GAMM|nr:PepSY-associated TM helix domain-containing protein [Arenimonas fontis]KAA2285072.1 PepSY domain-containing protein [Arenimonas fontis]
MKESLVRSMAWLHTWSGLLVGWLLFVIFVGGTLACFDSELDDWMRPWLHEARLPEQPRFDPALAWAQAHHPDAHAWYVLAGNARDRATEAYVYFDDGSHLRQTLHPVTGEPVPDTAGGEFFFTLHYDLHAGTFGMYVVGFAGMMMLVALVAGVITHRRLFADFFVFRPRAGGQRAWLDGHNLTGVLGLPFHLVMAYTGVAIFVANYMLAGVQVAYDGDVFRFYEEAGDLYERPEEGRPLSRLASADALLADAQRRLGQRVAWVSVHHPDDASATIAFGGDHSRAVAWNFEQVFYDAADGRFLHHTAPPGSGYGTYTFMGGLHMAQFGGSLVRALYFLLGLSGCVMIATGLQVWVRKRARQVAAAGALSGYGLVRGLNVGVVAGMPLAAAALLLANRLLPMDLADRAGAEVASFVWAWGLAAAWGAWRDRAGRGWRDLFAITAVLLAALPVANLLVTPDSALPATLARGDGALAAVDLVAWAFALAFAAMARRAYRRATAAPAAERLREAAA